MIEHLIPDFQDVYLEYSELFNAIDNGILNENNEQNINDLLSFQREFIKFDTKLRLGISITDISLDENFVDRKMGELKSCHLYFYKLADIWFAYETYFKFYFLALSVNLATRKVLWLDDATNSSYSTNVILINTLERANSELRNEFNNLSKRKALKDYLIYCRDYATNGQLKRLNTLLNQIDINIELPILKHTDFLTITYSIRNNFVHNGEVTIYPENFSYVLKSRLLKLLYKYLVVTTVKSASITIQKKLNLN